MFTLHMNFIPNAYEIIPVSHEFHKQATSISNEVHLNWLARYIIWMIPTVGNDTTAGVHSFTK